jgi:hypothetical protein
MQLGLIRVTFFSIYLRAHIHRITWLDYKTFRACTCIILHNALAAFRMTMSHMIMIHRFHVYEEYSRRVLWIFWQATVNYHLFSICIGLFFWKPAIKCSCYMFLLKYIMLGFVLFFFKYCTITLFKSITMLCGLTVLCGILSTFIYDKRHNPTQHTL